MSYQCDECGIELASAAEASGHRRRTHPSPRDLLDMGKELADQWVMIQACVIDRQWLWLTMALETHINTLKTWKTAVERLILR